MLFNSVGSEPNDPKAREVLFSTWPNLFVAHTAGGRPGPKLLRHECPWPLPNMERCTESDFWRYRASWTFQAEVWSQRQRFMHAPVSGWELVPRDVPYLEGHVYGQVMLYLVNHGSLQGGGYAVLILRGRDDKERIEYYKWRNCQHETTAKNVGRCQTQYTCKKCGYTYEVDSSD